MKMQKLNNAKLKSLKWLEKFKWLNSCIALSAMSMLVVGCAEAPPFPDLDLGYCQGKSDPSSQIILPPTPALTNREVSQTILAQLPERRYSRTLWRATGRSQFDTQSSVGFILVHAPLEKGLSPYTGGTLDVVTRLITASDKGRLFYTPQLNADNPSPLNGLKYISPSIFIMQSPHGEVGHDGTLTATKMDPLTVAQSGYIVNVSMRATPFTEQLAIPPRFTGLKYMDYNHDPARRGSNGPSAAAASGGQHGTNGRSGRNGNDARSYGGAGSRGESGTSATDGSRGSDGRRGADGQNGQHCTNSAPLDVKTIPLYSKFYEKPLVHYQFRRGSHANNVVMRWGQQLKVLARGGGGGDGGNGGSGGDGGRGGNGGVGGSGGRGGRGGSGRPGSAGSRGNDATRYSPGTMGGRGGSGGPGGPGGDGGSGGSGGDGGRGGDGGNGGNGGDGGNGGGGALVTVNIAGSGSFDQMIRSALKIDISGGRGGDGGDGGSGGSRGSGGYAGGKGSGGAGGYGGAGGPGGPGGAGGRSLSWTETKPNPSNPSMTMTVRRFMPGGLQGMRGANGPGGRTGNRGSDGESGAGGPNGNSGTPGRAGRNGSDGATGRVVYNAQMTSTSIVSGDVSMVRVSDGRIVAAASCRGPQDQLDQLTRQMANQLKAKISQRDATVAVTVFRDRSKSALGAAAAEELSVKLSGAMVDTDWFIVRERLYLKEILEERDLDLVGLVNNPEARKQLGGVEYVIVGSVSIQTK